MRRRIYLGLLIMALFVNITGCGKAEDNTSSTSPATTAVQPEDNKNPEMEDDTKDIVSGNNVMTDTPNSVQTQLPEDTKLAETKKPEVKTGHFSSSEQYSDINRVIKVLGLKEYKKLESEKYTDKAPKGKKFLILFLSIENNSGQDDYINYNYISAKIDGKNKEHTAIFNEPKNYPTIFNTIKAGKTAAGFIVWEVPSEWKKLEVNYDGWKDIDNLSLKAEFTPGDLSDPVIYNANDYN